MSAKRILRATFHSTLYIANVLCIVWLFLCLWAAHKDVSKLPSNISLLSLTCFFATLANIIFVCIWVFSQKKKWMSIFSFTGIILCWGVVKPSFGMHPFSIQPDSKDVPGIKVMTWNVHLFDLGEWTRDKTSKQKILDLIKKENPDILCLQEFYMKEDANAEPYTDVIRQLGYPYFEFYEETRVPQSYLTSNAVKGEYLQLGHAVFSKFPLENDQRNKLSPRHYGILSVDVVVDNTHTINLKVAHLASVRFNSKDIAYLEDLKDKGTKAEDDQQSRSIAFRLKKAFSIRAAQANIIDSVIDNTEFPVILCGDFNDVPGSYVYTKTKGHLSDAFVAKGFGLGRTYRHIMPTLRIDYIFYESDYLKTESYSSPDVHLSDHLPVIAEFSFVEKKK